MGSCLSNTQTVSCILLQINKFCQWNAHARLCTRPSLFLSNCKQQRTSEWYGDEATFSRKQECFLLNATCLSHFLLIFHLHAAHENNLLAVNIENHALRGSVWCMFLSAFQGVAFCEITLVTDPTFAYPEISPQRSLKTATAGENVSITDVGTLNANTTYYYNVSAVLDDNMTTPVVVQGFITTPPGELCIYSR